MTSPDARYQDPPPATTVDRARLKLLFAAVCDRPTAERDLALDALIVTPAERAALAPLLAADSMAYAPNDATDTNDAIDKADTDARGATPHSRPRLAALAASVVGTTAHRDETASGRLGQTLGPWTIEEIIGKGGMGLVYRARRSDGQFQQTVAIKFLTGLATSSAIQCLIDERRTLAAMEHPNIARLIDGGTTAEGTPYIAMDYVNGTTISEHCAKIGATIHDVVTLMLPVCDAVSHAHQSLTLHCDLKPENILVDTSGRPKLLDFGIAQMIDRVADEAAGAVVGSLAGTADAGRNARNATVVTPRSAAAFTPRYSSPEQRVGATLSTATDVFSLGRVLTELIDAAEARRAARRVGFGVINARTADEARAIATRASADKVLARYDSVAAMRSDLARLLNREPVLAMNGGPAYVLTKLLVRRWAMTLALSVLVIGSVVFTHNLARERDRALKAEARAASELQRAQIAEDDARAERDRAQVSELRANEREADTRVAREAAVVDRDRALRAERLSQTEAVRALRAETQAQVEVQNTREARDFLYSLFDGADPNRGGRAQTTAADLLARGRERIGKLPPQQRELKANMLLVLARVHENIGVPSVARGLYREIIALESDPSAERPAAHADALGRLAILEFNAGQAGAALPLAEKSLSIRRSLFSADSLEIADAQNTMGLALSGVGRGAEAIAAYNAALATRRRLLGDSSEEVASTMHNLALHFARNSQPSDAEPLYRQSLAIKKALFGPRHPKVLNTIERLAAMLATQRRFAEAEPLLTEALAARLEQQGPTSQGVATAANELGSLLHDMGRYPEAEKRYLEALNNPSYAPDADGRRSIQYAVVANNLAGLYEEIGDLAEGEKWYRQSMAIRRSRLAADDVSVARVEHNLGRLMTKRGELGEASELLTRAHATRMAKLGARHGDTHESILALAEIAAARGAAAVATPLLASLDASVIAQRPIRTILKLRIEAMLADAALAGTGQKIWDERASVAAARFGGTHLVALRAALDYAEALRRSGDDNAAAAVVARIASPLLQSLAADAPDRERLVKLQKN